MLLLIHDKPVFCCHSDLSKLHNIAVSGDDAFPEIDFKVVFRHAFKVPNTVPARKDVGL